MHVELLFWEGCPSYPRALADLRAAMADLGLDPSTVTLREIATDEQAVGERFVGSPTIRIDGTDIQPTGQEPFGLTCRVYHRRDGRVSPTPDPLDVREALLAPASHASAGQTDDDAAAATTPTTTTTDPVTDRPHPRERS
jgi:hypothetical protein